MNTDVGRQGEEMTRAWLLDQNWIIVAQNARVIGGELDFVALDPSQTLVFIEVKTDRELGFVLPAMRIDSNKQRQIWKCAQRWLQKHPEFQSRKGRFDAFSVILSPPQVHWHSNALTPFLD
jgi:putative endonuclease